MQNEGDRRPLSPVLDFHPIHNLHVAFLTLCHEQDGGQAKHAHPFPVIASPSASDPQTHSLTCLPPFPLYQLKGGCVPTESHGLVFQDMGFTVCEYSLWDSKQLCMDPNVLLDVAEVGGPAQNLLPRPDYDFIFLSSPPPLLSWKAFTRLGFAWPFSRNQHGGSLLHVS